MTNPEWYQHVIKQPPFQLVDQDTKSRLEKQWTNIVDVTKQIDDINLEIKQIKAKLTK
jgi:hypothetical protein